MPSVLPPPFHTSHTAVLTRLNAARMSVGKSQIGFANPMLCTLRGTVLDGSLCFIFLPLAELT